MNLNKTIDSRKWKYLFEFIWIIGIFILIGYGIHYWPPNIKEADHFSYFAQILILLGWSAGYIGLRLRFYQLLNLKVFLMCLSSAVAIGFIFLSSIDYVSSHALDISTISYVWVMAYLVLKK